MLLLPLIIVGAGAILLMLASAYKTITHEMAAYGSALIFAVAFLVQLTFCIQGNAILFSEPLTVYSLRTVFQKVPGSLSWLVVSLRF
jgi:NADH-quinone oxidoreductase subunit N